jgi:dockerin type I
MKKSEIKMAAWLLSLSLMGFTITGCAANAAKNSSNESTISVQQTSSVKSSDTESKDNETKTTSTSNRDLSSIYSEEDLNTSWDKSSSTIITLNGSEAKVEGSGANYSDGKVNITSSGTYVLSGKFTGQIYIDAKDSAVVHLVLNGVEINSESGPAIYAADGKKVILTLAESTENTLSDTSNYTFADGEDEPDATLFIKNDLVINGSGTLKVNANYKTAIKTKDTLAIISGNFDLTSVDNAVRAKDALTVEAGTFKVNATGKGFTSDGELNIYGGDINIEKSEEGLEGLTVEIYGGNVDISATDDGINARTKYDDSVSDAEKEMLGNQDQDGVEVRIAGGTVNINASGDAIDSNGDLYIEGGETYISGPTSGGDGTLDYNGEAKITKGVYVGAGSSGMFQTFSEDSSQNFINVYYDSTQAAGTTITLSDESQTKLIEFVAEKEFATVVISLPSLETGKTYTLKTGDTEQTVTINSVSSSLGTSSGGFGDPGGHGGFGEPHGGGQDGSQGGFGRPQGGGQGRSQGGGQDGSQDSGQGRPGRRQGGGFGEPQGGGQDGSQGSGQGRPGRGQGGGFGEPNGQQPPDRRGSSEGRQGNSSNNQDTRGGRGRNFDNQEQYGWENNSWDNGAWEGGQYPQDNQGWGSYDSQGYY